jgi:hypothetical protein
MEIRRRAMDWEHWFCPDHYCSVEFWMAQPSPARPELWQITDRFGGGSFTVAGVDPVCPRCGTTLAMSVEIAQRAGEVLEMGPMYEFVYSLRS